MSVTINDILAELIGRKGSRSETPALDAQVLLAHFLERPRTWILAHPAATVAEARLDQVRQAAARLSQGEPLPYILGHWEFYGLDFSLTPHVLIPRPETELLVEKAINWLRAHPKRRNAIDVGTGSGCIGISLAKTIPDLHLVMTDISLQALHIAAVNIDKHGLTQRLRLIQSDLLQGITGPFDLVGANLPYIPTNTLLSLPVAGPEPRLALDGGVDGTTYIIKLLEQAKNNLAPGGLMLLEIDASQGETVERLARKHFVAPKVQIFKDLAGLDRCLEIERTSSIVHICPLCEWREAVKTGTFQDESLERNGFIHCSMPEQVLDVANRFYSDAPELAVLWIDSSTLVSEIRWESTDGSIYPHVHGPIDLAAVRSVIPLQADHDGIYRTLNLPA